MSKTQNIFSVRAISLVELLLVLAVIAAITLMSLKLYVNARTNAKVAQIVAQINKLTEASYRWLDMQNQENFCGTKPVPKIDECNNPVNRTKLIQAGLARDSDFRSPWNFSVGYGVNPSAPVGASLELNVRLAVGLRVNNQAVCLKLLKALEPKAYKFNNNPQVFCVPNPRKEVDFIVLF